MECCGITNLIGCLFDIPKQIDGLAYDNAPKCVRENILDHLQVQNGRKPDGCIMRVAKVFARVIADAFLVPCELAVGILGMGWSIVRIVVTTPLNVISKCLGFGNKASQSLGSNEEEDTSFNPTKHNSSVFSTDDSKKEPLTPKKLADESSDNES